MSYNQKPPGPSGSSGSIGSSASNGPNNQTPQQVAKALAGIQQQMQSLVHGQNALPQSSPADFNAFFQQHRFQNMIKQQQQQQLIQQHFQQQIQQQQNKDRGGNVAEPLALTRTPAAAELLNKTYQQHHQQQANGSSSASSTLASVNQQFQQQLQAFPPNIMQQLQALQYQMQQQHPQPQQHHAHAPQQAHQSHSTQQTSQQQMHGQTQQQKTLTTAAAAAHMQQLQQSLQQKYLSVAAAAASQPGTTTKANAALLPPANQSIQIKQPIIPSSTLITPVTATTTSSASPAAVKNASPALTFPSISAAVNQVIPSITLIPTKAPVISATTLSANQQNKNVGCKSSPIESEFPCPSAHYHKPLVAPTSTAMITSGVAPLVSPVKTTTNSETNITSTPQNSITINTQLEPAIAVISNPEFKNSPSISPEITSTIMAKTTTPSVTCTYASIQPKEQMSSNNENITNIVKTDFVSDNIPATSIQLKELEALKVPVGMVAESTSSDAIQKSTYLETTSLDMKGNVSSSLNKPSEFQIDSDIVVDNNTNQQSTSAETTCVSSIPQEKNVNELSKETIEGCSHIFNSKNDDSKTQTNINKQVEVPTLSPNKSIVISIAKSLNETQMNTKNADEVSCKPTTALKMERNKVLEKTIDNFAVPPDESCLINTNTIVTKDSSDELITSSEMVKQKESEKLLVDQPILQSSELQAEVQETDIIVHSQEDGTKTKEQFVTVEATAKNTGRIAKTLKSSTIISEKTESSLKRTAREEKRKKTDIFTESSPSTPNESNKTNDRKSQRHRLKTILYQSPLPELAFITKLSASEASNSPKPMSVEDKLIVFYKNEYMAVRNAEGTFYICQTMQNVYRTSPRISIRWLSEDKKDSTVFMPDFYDHTDIECVLTTVELKRIDKGHLRLPKAEKLRIESILKKAIDVEKGLLPRPDVTEENPDGLDISLYKDESQIEKKSSGGLSLSTSVRKMRRIRSNFTISSSTDTTEIKRKRGYISGVSKSPTKKRKSLSKKKKHDNNNSSDEDDTTDEESDTEYKPNQKKNNSTCKSSSRTQRSPLARAKAASPITPTSSKTKIDVPQTNTFAPTTISRNHRVIKRNTEYLPTTYAKKLVAKSTNLKYLDTGAELPNKKSTDTSVTSLNSSEHSPTSPVIVVTGHNPVGPRSTRIRK